jgi:hypothetical protein
VKTAPSSEGKGTTTTLERSRTTVPLPSVTLRVARGDEEADALSDVGLVAGHRGPAVGVVVPVHGVARRGPAVAVEAAPVLDAPRGVEPPAHLEDDPERVLEVVAGGDEGDVGPAARAVAAGEVDVDAVAVEVEARDGRRRGPVRDVGRGVEHRRLGEVERRRDARVGRRGPDVGGAGVEGAASATVKACVAPVGIDSPASSSTRGSPGWSGSLSSPAASL